jgi:hypothetical protein
MAGYLTSSKLSNILDLPVQIPATEVKMGDWVVIGTIKIATPQRLRFRFLNLQLHTANVSISDITATNKILGNLGYAYVALRRDYSSGNPGAAGALEVLNISEIGLVERATDEAIYTTPGRYSWIIANNMQPSSTSNVPTSTEINFRLSATGQVRLELDNA